jgi:hypothetical protein
MHIIEFQINVSVSHTKMIVLDKISIGAQIYKNLFTCKCYQQKVQIDFLTL